MSRARLRSTAVFIIALAGPMVAGTPGLANHRFHRPARSQAKTAIWPAAPAASRMRDAMAAGRIIAWTLSTEA